MKYFSVVQSLQNVFISNNTKKSLIIEKHFCGGILEIKHK